MSDFISLNLLYFAKLGEDLNCSGETIELPRGSHLEDLISHLCHRSQKWEALKAPGIHNAVNQTINKENLALHDGDEIAFFPPVTGG